MKVPITCPGCGHLVQFPEEHLGRRYKCPGCGESVSTRKPGPDAPGDDFYAPPKARVGPGGREEDSGDRGPSWTLNARVRRDPDRRLKGPVQVEVGPRGLAFLAPKTGAELARVRVGRTSARDLGKGLFAVEVDGREVSLGVAQLNLYTHRLIPDLVGFLNRERGPLDLDDYVIPRPLVGALYAPIALVGVGMVGGAIGGGISGAIAGALMSANRAIVRKESWSVAARLWACIGTSLAGTVAAVGLYLVVLMQLFPGLIPRPQQQPQPPPPAPFPAPQLWPKPKPDPNPNPKPDFRPNPGPADPVPGPGPDLDSDPGTSSTPLAPPKPVAATGMDGLVGYWPLDDGAGSGATDASGRGNEGTLTHAKWVKGARDGAVEFSGDGFLDLGGSVDLNFQAGGSFTVAAWFRSEAWVGPVVSFRNAKEGAPVVDIVLDGKSVAATVREDGDESPAMTKLAGEPIRDDGWHHVALVRRGGAKVALYLDGKLHRESPATKSGGAITTDLRSAGAERYWIKTGWPAPHYFNGAIDEVCVFKRDLPADEIRRLAGR